jgi:hypothetical protein
LIEQLLQQAQFVLVLVALGVVEQSAGGQAEHTDELQEGETAAGLLSAGLGISELVFGGVRSADAGAVNDFDTKATPEVAVFFGIGSGGAAQARQDVPRQPVSGLTVGAGAFVHGAATFQRKEGLDLADNLAAGAVGIEDLIEKAKEGAAQGIDALTAVGTFLGLGEQVRGQERGEEFFQVQETLLAQGVDPFAQGGEAGAEGWEERSFH